MLEVVFSDSAAGSMALASGGPEGTIAGSVGVIGQHADGSPCTEEELREYRRQLEERERRNWASALPFESRRADILCFPLALSVGEIDEEGIGQGREAALKKLMSVYPTEERNAAAELLDTARESLAVLHARAGSEPVRVWTSQGPDERCGLAWLAAQLEPLGPEKLAVTVVELPEFIRTDWAPVELPDPAEWPETPAAVPQGDGSVVVSCTGWGEIEPHQFGRLAALARPAPMGELRALALQWRQLRRENAPLRAVLNGRLVSVPESLYDPFLWREIEAQPEEFQEAMVIGRVLGKYQLGIGDGWAALRIEELIRQGLLLPVGQPDPDAPVYHRLLRRARHGQQLRHGKQL